MKLRQRFAAFFSPPQATSDMPGRWVEMTGQARWTGTLTERGAMNISAVYCAVSLRSDSVGSMPLILYERKDGGKVRADTHPVYKLLHQRPNKNISPARFKKLMEGWRSLWGNAYAEIEKRRGDKSPVALWPIHPGRVKPKLRPNGDIFWEVRNNDGTQTTIADADMFHIMGPSNDGVVGMSLIGKARDSLGLTESAEAYGRRFFTNSAVPSGIIEHPGTLKPDARTNLRTSWERMQSGENQGKTALLEEGMKFNAIGMSSEDAQFLETRQFQIVEIARWFNVPPHKLKDLTRATFSNIEEQNIEYVQDCIMPLAIDFEEECDKKLLSEAEQGRYFSEFLVDGLLRANMQTRYAAYAVGRQWGWLSANDVRGRENMNLLDNDEGDIYLVPMNMTPANLVDELVESQIKKNQTVATPPTPDKPPPDGNGNPDTEKEPDANNPTVPKIAAAFVDVFAGAYTRMLTKESKAAERAARTPGTFKAWTDKFYADHVLLVRDALIPACESFAATLAAVGNVSISPESIAVATQTLAERHCERYKGFLLADAGAISGDKLPCFAAAQAKESIALFMELVHK